MRPLGLAGQRAPQARLARLCRSHRSPSDRRTTGVSPYHTMTCTDVGGRVTDGAGSSVAVEWSDRARTVALQPLPGWCGSVYKPGWFWPLQMAERVSKRATRGGETQSTEARLFSWRLRARRFVGSVTQRRGGPPAHRPSGRGPGCGFASDRAIPPPSQAGVGFGLGVSKPQFIAPRTLATSGRRPGVRAKRAACGVAGRQVWGQAGARKPYTHL